MTKLTFISLIFVFSTFNSLNAKEKDWHWHTSEVILIWWISKVCCLLFNMQEIWRAFEKRSFISKERILSYILYCHFNQSFFQKYQTNQGYKFWNSQTWRKLWVNFLWHFRLNTIPWDLLQLSLQVIFPFSLRLVKWLSFHANSIANFFLKTFLSSSLWPLN